MILAQNLGNIPVAPHRLGPIGLDGGAMLAPMSGVSDLGMRRAASRFGATLVFSEMVASQIFLDGDGESRLRAQGDGVASHAVQLVGREPGAMGEAARRVEGAGARVVDINMGCPARRVAGGLAGCALMRDLDHASRIIESVVAAVSAPVTVKMRLGWDEDERNAARLARRAEQAGAAMITVHGRTRRQFYDGRADWRAVGEVVAEVGVPVVVNGDCRSLEDARAMLAASGARAVMIGRAAIGAPWIVGSIARALQSGAALSEPPLDERRDAALSHLDSLLAAMGRRAGLRHARKHLAAYAEKAGAAPAIRSALVTSEDADVAMGLLARAFEGAEDREAA
ncbi:MAG: tRNA dihydrouridine synthase DusB [Roseiarcus sp.]|jgi:nifR3 family TIM-barrel protein